MTYRHLHVIWHLRHEIRVHTAVSPVTIAILVVGHVDARFVRLEEGRGLVQEPVVSLVTVTSCLEMFNVNFLSLFQNGGDSWIWPLELSIKHKIQHF